MSLRLTLSLMALVSALMVAAVVYRKILSPEMVTVGERKAVERICGDRCGQAAGDLGADATAEEVARVARDCIDRCTSHLLSGRARLAKSPSEPAPAR